MDPTSHGGERAKDETRAYLVLPEKILLKIMISLADHALPELGRIVCEGDSGFTMESLRRVKALILADDRIFVPTVRPYMTKACVQTILEVRPHRAC